MKKQQSKWIGLALEALFFIAGLGCYIWIVTGSHSINTREFLSWLVNEKAVILFGLILFYLVTYQLPGWIGRSIRWIGLISLFGAFLKGYWIIKRTAFFQVFGLLPYVDATEYFSNAQRLLMGFAAQGTTIGRPLFTSFFTGILWSSDYNLQITLLIMVAVVGLSLHLLQESTLRHFGMLPAAILSTFTFMFYRNYLGGISSEALGLIFGCLGWVALFECFREVKIRYLVTALFLLTLALVTRAGPFLVLPFILLAFLLIYISKKDRITHTISAGIAVIGGFLANSSVLKILSHNQSYLFPNYLYSLYGIAAGGKGWGYIKGARPDLMVMQEPERTNQIYAATLDLIKSQPMVFIWNMLKQYWYFVLYGNTSLFSYLYTNFDWFNLSLMVVLYSLSILTVILQIRDRKNLKSLVILGVTLGIILSVPFVPPQDESNMRAFAVTVPIMALIPAISLRWLCNELSARLKVKSIVDKIFHTTSPDPSHFLRGLGIATIVLVLAASISPAIFLNGIDRMQSIHQPPTCEQNETPIVWQNIPANNIWIAKEVNPGSVNEITTLQLQKLLHNIYMSDKMPLFQNLHARIQLTETVNYLNGTSSWLMVPGKIPLDEQGMYSGCGVFNKSTDIYLFDYIEITRAQKFSD